MLSNFNVYGDCVSPDPWVNMKTVNYADDQGVFISLLHFLNSLT